MWIGNKYFVPCLKYDPTDLKGDFYFGPDGPWKEYFPPLYTWKYFYIKLIGFCRSK